MINIIVLETSACIEYALNVTTQSHGKYIHIKSDHNRKLTRFVPVCGERWHTSTIEREANHSIQKAVNELVDERLNRRKGTYIIRKNLRNKAKENLKELFESSVLKNPGTIDLQQIVLFYENINQTQVGRLDELRLRKRVDNILPEPNDLRILAEVVELAKLDDIGLISGDAHFTEFKDEISDEFGINILDYYDLIKFIPN